MQRDQANICVTREGSMQHGPSKVWRRKYSGGITIVQKTRTCVESMAPLTMPLINSVALINNGGQI